MPWRVVYPRRGGVDEATTFYPPGTVMILAPQDVVYRHDGTQWRYLGHRRDLVLPPEFPSLFSLRPGYITIIAPVEET